MLTWSAVPQVEELAGLRAATDAVLASRTLDAPFYTIGARWDFHDSAAFKAEYTNSEQVDGSDAGLFQVALVTVF